MDSIPEAEHGSAAKQRDEVEHYHSRLVLKASESMDLDLLNPNRSVIYSGKLLRKSESVFEWSSGWSELFVLLFDNYLVMTEARELDGVTKYQVNERPVPLDLLTLVSFTEAPTRRDTRFLRGLRAASGNSSLFPLTLHYNGRTGGPFNLYAQTSEDRSEWKEKLEEALFLRRIVEDSNKAFDPQMLSDDRTFLLPSLTVNAKSLGPDIQDQYTGKVTCSVPFTTPNGRSLVAIGCAEGVWIGFQHDAKSFKRVLHLKRVTQCAMLEEFGIFIVLADKSLWAYHLETLVPTHPPDPESVTSRFVPQKLNGDKDVSFFRVGNLYGRTLIIYAKKRGRDTVFCVLEPLEDKINESLRNPSKLGFRTSRSEWFRVYRDFFLPKESFDIIFLTARIVILCCDGFEIMDLNDFASTTVPVFDNNRDPLAKRCRSAQPLGMFRSNEDGFLLCYDEFGLYVNKHGEPSQQRAIVEWEGTANHVALHAPYLMIFNDQFIEVRDLDTGRLVQIIAGNNVRCIWDSRALNGTISTKEDDDQIIQKAHVHAVMNKLASSAGSKVIGQCVVELIPTLLLSESVPLVMQDKADSEASLVSEEGNDVFLHSHPSQSSPTES